MQAETCESLQSQLKILHKNLTTLEERKARLGLDVTARVLNEAVLQVQPEVADAAQEFHLR